MLDKKTTLVLKTLNKLSEGSAYKVVTAEEILSSLNAKSQFDIDSIKQIMEFLEKQEYITIKFSEDNTYCFSLSPKGRISLEQNGPKAKQKKSNFPILTYLFVMLASFVGSLLALLIFFYVTF